MLKLKGRNVHRALRVLTEALEKRDLLTAVTATAPYNGQQNVATNASIVITFDVALSTATVNTANFTLRNSANSAIATNVTWNATNKTVTLAPTGALTASNNFYYVKVLGGSSGVKDAANNPLPSDYNFGFSTGAPVFSEGAAISGLTLPTTFQIAPDGKVFVAEKSGTIKIFPSLTSTTPTVFSDLRTSVHNYWDRGLLGMALDPQFPTRPYVYVLYTYDAPIGGTAPAWGTVGGFDDPGPGTTGNGPAVSGRLSRLTVSGNTIVSGSELILINDWAQQYPSHSIGALQFGPDGMLYATAGDGASFNAVDYGQNNLIGDPTNEGGALRAQDLLSSGDPTGLDGSMIRIDPNTGLAPTDNPNFSAGPDQNAKRIIAEGLRNPFRFTFRPGTSEIWISEVGWNTWEEINRLVPGSVRNFGWPAYEGVGRQSGYDAANLPILENLYAQGAGAVVSPYYTYNHSEKVVAGSSEPTGGSSSTGVAFYNGGQYPSVYDGALFFADYSRKQIYIMYRGANGLPDPSTRQIFNSPANGPIDLKIGPNGDLFWVDMNGGSIRRFTYSSTNQPPVARATVSQSVGVAPLTVTFNGTTSSDADAGDILTYSWDLNGDGTFGDATTPTASYTYTANGLYNAALRVTDRAGASSTVTLPIQVGVSPPVPVISSPLSTFKWKVGDAINFAGSASDPQSGVLPASALNWSLILHHQDPTGTSEHTHPVTGISGVASGAFTAIDHEYPSYLELKLTATNSFGLSASTSVRLDAQTVTLTLVSNPAGLNLGLNSEAVAAPFTRAVIIGSSNTISAPATATIGSTTYQFQGWSDSGIASHNIVAPATNATFTANYVAVNVAPAAPSNLSSTVLTNSSARITWADNSSNETGFKVERRYENWIWGQIALVDPNVTTFTETGLYPGVIYEYRVRAVNASGDSNYSNIVKANMSVIGAQIPAAPSGLNAIAISGTRVDLSWTDNSSNEDQFKIERQTGAGAFTQIGSTAANVKIFSDTSAVPGASYTYRVLASNTDGDSNYSNSATVTTPSGGGVPTAPANLAAVTATAGNVKITWSDTSSNETSFTIERRYSNWLWDTVYTVGANVTSFTDTATYSSVEYEYRVKATGPGGDSLYSNMITVRVT